MTARLAFFLALLSPTHAAAPAPARSSTPPPAPAIVTIATVRGEQYLPVLADASGAPMVSGGALVAALGGTLRISGSWAEVSIARQPIRFLLGAPYFVAGNRVQPLAASAALTHDTLYIPLQVVAEILPRLFSARYRYDSAAARLIEAGAPPAAPAPAATITANDERPAPGRLASGIRPGHVVTIDPGHGGVDPGNPGMFFPRGVREKDVTLQIGLLVRDELKRRGITVRMTRTTDTLIALGDRGSYCSERCDLFLSIHVNSLPKRPGFTTARGFETYFLAEAKTEDARRVARMENEAVRFEANAVDQRATTGLDFILKDLQLNEHLRESALLAATVQQKLDVVHSGTNRGVKQAGFMVLTTARRPAILAELGYSTNPEDGRMLTQPATQRTLATALADAVVAYLREYERRSDDRADSGAGR
ncbi:MAG: N-acetylmuramoyl-L-alanine amidase [Gemmatimonadota bacterium]